MSTSSSTPVTVTVCFVFQFVVLNVSDAGVTVATPASPVDTATVTAAVGSVDSATVYVVVRPAPAASVTVTPVFDSSSPRSSSSSIVSVWFTGFVTPLPPLDAPDTVTVLFAASTSLSFAVIVTVSVLAVEPAAIVSFVLVDNV